LRDRNAEEKDEKRKNIGKKKERKKDKEGQ
jgi:hypothetical protein